HSWRWFALAHARAALADYACGNSVARALAARSQAQPRGACGLAAQQTRADRVCAGRTVCPRWHVRCGLCPNQWARRGPARMALADCGAALALRLTDLADSL